jgi:hypothetical protein
MKKVSFVLASIAASVVVSAPAQTQSTTAGSCSDVKWTAEMLKKYPDIAKSCVDVVVRDGVRYVKVSGKVSKKSTDAVTVRLDNTNSDITWKPAAGDNVLIDNKPMAAKDVEVGQHLRFYMREDHVAVVNLTDKEATTRQVVE